MESDDNSVWKVLTVQCGRQFSVDSSVLTVQCVVLTVQCGECLQFSVESALQTLNHCPVASWCAMAETGS